jgi:hypothetical protein
LHGKIPKISLSCPKTLSHTVSFIIIVTVTPIYFSLPPYSFTSRQQGLTYIGPTVGSVLGGLILGKLNDIVVRILSKRNDGVFEPEMRLPMTTVPMLATITGLIMFGVGVQNGDHWIVPVLGSTFVAVGLASVPSTLQPYLIDSYFPASLDVSTVRCAPLSCLSYNLPTSSFSSDLKISSSSRSRLALALGLRLMGLVPSLEYLQL